MVEGRPQQQSDRNTGMRLLFLCKRRPQARDLMERPYGRFFNLPNELATLGHRSTLVLFDYSSGADRTARIDGVEVVSLGARCMPGALWRRLVELATELSPDWIVGFSDLWFGILAERLARRVGARCAIDAYDNYEAYIPWALPAHMLWRCAIARADLVTAAGKPLLEFMTRQGTRAKKLVVPMAADPVFHPRDRRECRERLGLPQDIPLIGYAGSLHRSRDTALLLATMRQISRQLPSARFVLSGRRLQKLELPSNALHLGYLADDQVPLLICASNVVLSINQPSAFGEHSYPVKIYEAAACGVPFIATRTAATTWITAGSGARLCEPGNVASVNESISCVLGAGITRHFACERWPSIARNMEFGLESAR